MTTLTLTGTGEYASPRRLADHQWVTMTAVAYCSGEFPKFRRWLLDHATGTPELAGWLVSIQARDLTRIAIALNEGRPT